MCGRRTAAELGRGPQVEPCSPGLQKSLSQLLLLLHVPRPSSGFSWEEREQALPAPALRPVGGSPLTGHHPACASFSSTPSLPVTLCCIHPPPATWAVAAPSAQMGGVLKHQHEALRPSAALERGSGRMGELLPAVLGAGGGDGRQLAHRRCRARPEDAIIRSERPVHRAGHQLGCSPHVTRPARHPGRQGSGPAGSPPPLLGWIRSHEWTFQSLDCMIFRVDSSP